MNKATKSILIFAGLYGFAFGVGVVEGIGLSDKWWCRELQAIVDEWYRSTANRVANNFDDIIFESRADADAVLEELCNICEQYKEVSIGDFYDAARVSRNGFTDNNFGWTSLQGAYVSRGRGGWVINMPKVKELK